MVPRGILRFSVLLPVGLCLAGCASVAPSPMSFSVRRVVTADRGAVFQSARAVLVDRGYRIDAAESQAGRITTYPIEISDAASSRGVSTPRSHQRLVEVRMSRDGGETSIYCRALRLRQTTEAHRLLAIEQRSDDRPGRTPIEREGATSRRQNTVWETVGRNKPYERALLADIVARLAMTPGPKK